MTNEEASLRGVHTAEWLIGYIEAELGLGTFASRADQRFVRILPIVNSVAFDPMGELIATLRRALSASDSLPVWNRACAEWRVIRVAVWGLLSHGANAVVFAFDSQLLAVRACIGADWVAFDRDQNQAVGSTRKIANALKGRADSPSRMRAMDAAGRDHPDDAPLMHTEELV